MSDKTLKLSSGHTVPVLGFGTWKSEPKKVGAAVEVAIRAGYRHIDGAALYGNEKEIGEVLTKLFEEKVVKREELFYTSKLWNTDWDNVEAACKKTLSDLNLKYLDLYLVHTPASFISGEGSFPKADGVAKMGKVPVHEMWKNMEKLVDAGLVRSIGLSNFPVLMIHDILTYCRIKPAMHQIEIHPFFTQKKNADYCLSQGIQVTAYSPLGNASDESPLKSDVIKNFAKKYSVSAGQLLIRWSIQNGYIVIPKKKKLFLKYELL